MSNICQEDIQLICICCIDKFIINLMRYVIQIMKTAENIYRNNVHMGNVKYVCRISNSKTNHTIIKFIIKLRYIYHTDNENC